LFRREIIQHTLLAICDCIQFLLMLSHVSLTFLMMYGAMWSLDLRFDTRFFAVAFCILGFMRICVIEYFTSAVRELSHYLPAQKRIKVRINGC
jgi:hypothetical protein